MNETIVKGMIDKMTVTDTKPTYASLKRREEELLAELKDLRDEIKNAEEGIVEEKLETAIKRLEEVDKLTSGYYNLTLEKYCGGCDDYVDIDFTLAEFIEILQQIK